MSWYAVGYVTGGTGQIRKRSDAGAWSVFAGPVAAGYLTCVWAADDDNIWVGDAAGQIFYWNGATWTLTTTLETRASSIWGLSAVDVYAVADCFGSEIYHHWNGAAWSTTTILGGGESHRTAFVTDSTGRVYAAGRSAGLYSYDETPLVYKDAGGVWKYDSTIPNMHWGSGWAYGAGIGWLGGTTMVLAFVEWHSNALNKVYIGSPGAWVNVFSSSAWNPGDYFIANPNNRYNNCVYVDRETGDIFITGIGTNGSSSNEGYVLRYNGATWTWLRNSSKTYSHPTCIAGAPGGDIYTVWINGTDTNLISKWNGTAFVEENVQAAGSSANYYGICHCDSTDPTIDNELPEPDSTGVALTSAIGLDAIDSDSGVNPATFSLSIGTIAPVPAVIDGVAQSGFTFTATPGTDKYTFSVGHSVAFSPYTLKSISGTVSDFNGNEAGFSWEFTTIATDPPYLDSINTGSGSSGIAVDADISFDILSDHNIVDEVETKIYVSGISAYVSSKQQIGFIDTVETLLNGYRYTVGHLNDFEHGTPITIRVVAKDIDGNAMDYSYIFTTIPFSMTEDVELDLRLTSVWDLDRNGKDLALVSGLALVKQRLLMTLRLFMGEWFGNPDAGIPWFQQVFVKQQNSRIIEALLRKTILNSWGIQSLTAFSVINSKDTRSLTVTFSAVSSYGTLDMNVKLL